MSAWFLSITGVIALGALVEIIMPEGENGKYVKGVYALVAALVIAAPIASFIKKGADADITALDGAVFEADASFVKSVERERLDALGGRLEKALDACGVEQAEVRLYKKRGSAFEVAAVKVDITESSAKASEYGEKIKKIAAGLTGCEEVYVYDRKKQ